MVPPLIGKIAYVIYFAVLVMSQRFLLAVPGRRVPIYALLGIIASVPVLCESRRLRLGAVPAIVLAMGLVTYDYYAGARYDASIVQLKQQINERDTKRPAPVRTRPTAE